MDAATVELLRLDPVPLAQQIAQIQQVHGEVAGKELTLDTVREILGSIDRVFYQGRFLAYATSQEFPTLNIVDTDKPCIETDAFLEAVAYDETDPESAQYAYGFKLALRCLRELTLEPTEVFYSGGFLTRDKLMFVILMMLHESLHIIEYKDALLTTAKSSHTVFFYKEGYRRFGLLSRLSEVTTQDSIQKTADARIAAIQALPSDPTADGIELLFDHSHAKRGRKRVFLGYIAHGIPLLGGRKRAQTLRQRRRARTVRKKSRV